MRNELKRNLPVGLLETAWETCQILWKTKRNRLTVVREAVKKVIFLVVRPLRPKPPPPRLSGHRIFFFFFFKTM